ncbi:MAG TPA: class I SAM-dependent methyltransferase [Stellaceae bacterium]|nr:class I SAM-dependent methyltransferase [Stellaceae bacterium]HMD66959.1 class I SAM-dependent methyltransferase [Stellaceae bacterium]
MTSHQTDIVKEQVAAHWGRRAPGFDDGFGHSIRTPAERAAWDRIFDLVLPRRGALEALDAGCGTGFLSFELAARGHRVTGVDFAPAMLAEARRKAAQQDFSVHFEEADAERLSFPAGSFDLAISRHVLWTLPHPEAAIDEWIRVLRPGGRLVVLDGQFDPGFLVEPSQNARTSAEYAAIGDRLPFLGGRPREEIEALFKAHGLVGVGSDPVPDLVEAQAQRMVEEGGKRQTRKRYVVWGDVPR